MEFVTSSIDDGRDVEKAQVRSELESPQGGQFDTAGRSISALHCSKRNRNSRLMTNVLSD